MVWADAEWGMGVLFAVALLLVVFVVAGLFLRRRMLSRRGRVFDCAANLRPQLRGTWSAGMARYEGDTFEWYRIFSLAVGPTLVLRRGARIVAQRGRESAEADDLPGLDTVLSVEIPGRHGAPRIIDLAMTPASATGLMSWLEAAPPGV